MKELLSLRYPFPGLTSSLGTAVAERNVPLLAAADEGVVAVRAEYRKRYAPEVPRPFSPWTTYSPWGPPSLLDYALSTGYRRLVFAPLRFANTNGIDPIDGVGLGVWNVHKFADDARPSG